VEPVALRNRNMVRWFQAVLGRKNMKNKLYTQTFWGIAVLVGCCHRAHTEELACVLGHCRCHASRCAT
jgi:hypothetical protein